MSLNETNPEKPSAFSPFRVKLIAPAAAVPRRGGSAVSLEAPRTVLRAGHA